MMLRWMCVVSDLYSPLEFESVAEVVRHGRLRWFGHVERKSGDDWVSACSGRCEMCGQGQEDFGEHV